MCERNDVRRRSVGASEGRRKRHSAWPANEGLGGGVSGAAGAAAAVGTAATNGRQLGGLEARLAVSQPAPGSHCGIAARSETFVAHRLRASPVRCAVKMLLLPLLLLLSVGALLPAEALKCYDCLSKSLPDCVDGEKMKSFDQINCSPDEKYCSTLLMKDSTGRKLLSRQCASKPDEGEQLKNYLSASHDKNLKVVQFEVCRSDLCNAAPGSGGLPSAGLLALALAALAASRLGV